MNILKKLLKGIIGLIAGLILLLFLLVALCAAFPDLSDGIANLLYSPSSLIQRLIPDKTDDAEAEGSPIESATTSANSIAQTQHASPEELLEDGISKVPEELYVPPEKNELSIPEEVADKTGYEPIRQEKQEVDDTKGEELASTLGYGETGEGLEFDARFYPYYDMLDDDLKGLYRQIYANMKALNGSFTPIVQVQENRLKNAFTAVFCDHPELFWVDTAYSCKFRSDGTCVEIDLQFNSTSDNLDANKSMFETRANEIANAASGAGTDYEKEVAVHDALISQINYNLSAPLNQSAYSALVNGQTVCAGYARAFQYVMQQLQVPCYYCMGYAGESHAWNIIELDGEYYNVDSTWDDTEPNTYDYFNKSDADFNGNHMRQDLSVYLPPCNGQKYCNLEASPTQGTSEIPVPQQDNGAASMLMTDENPENGGENGSFDNNRSNGNSNNVNADMGQNLRSLSDIGMTADNVLNTKEGYYADCYNQIVKTGAGSYQFQNVISGQDLYSQIFNDYSNGNYKTAFVNDALSQLGARQFHVNIKIEELAEGYYLMIHNVTLQ